MSFNIYLSHTLNAKAVIYPKSLQSLFFRILVGNPNNKYCVTACIEPKFLVFLISSELSPIKKSNPELLECQVKLKADDYPSFLKWDSWLDCTDLFSYDIGEATQALSAEDWRILGQLSEYDAKRVVKAVSKAPTLSPIQSNWILGSYGAK